VDIAIYLCEQGWILLYTSVSKDGYCYIREGEGETGASVHLFSDMPRALFESIALSFCLVLFSAIDQICFEMTWNIYSVRSWCPKR